MFSFFGSAAAKMHKRTLTMIHLLGASMVLMVTFVVSPIQAGDGGCNSDDECEIGKCLIKSNSNQGRCLNWQTNVNNMETSPKSSRDAYQEGGMCQFSVDCPPSHSCYLISPGSALGVCLIDIDSRYEIIEYDLP